MVKILSLYHINRRRSDYMNLMDIDLQKMGLSENSELNESLLKIQKLLIETQEKTRISIFDQTNLKGWLVTEIQKINCSSFRRDLLEYLLDHLNEISQYPLVEAVHIHFNVYINIESYLRYYSGSQRSARYFKIVNELIEELQRIFDKHDLSFSSVEPQRKGDQYLTLCWKTENPIKLQDYLHYPKLLMSFVDFIQSVESNDLHGRRYIAGYSPKIYVSNELRFIQVSENFTDINFQSYFN